MASVYSGRGSALGLGVESTWGTFNAPSGAAWLLPLSFDLRRVIPRQPRAVLTNGASAPMVRSHYDESDTVQGSFSVEASYISLPLLLEWAMGASATSGAGVPYTHTQTLGNEVPFGLSIDAMRGSGGTSDKFEGCVCTSFDLAVSAGGGPMTFSANVLGKTAGTNRGSASSPTFSTVDAPVLYHQAGTFDWNSGNYRLIDFSVNVDNAFGPRIRLGSLNTLEPKRTGFMNVTTSITLDVEDGLLSAYLAGTSSDYSLAFTGSGDYAMTIAGHNALITDISDPVNSAGILTQTVTFTHRSDGTDDGLSIAVDNNEADNRTVEAS